MGLIKVWWVCKVNGVSYCGLESIMMCWGWLVGAEQEMSWDFGVCWWWAGDFTMYIGLLSRVATPMIVNIAIAIVGMCARDAGGWIQLELWAKSESRQTQTKSNDFSSCGESKSIYAMDKNPVCVMTVCNGGVDREHGSSETEELDDGWQHLREDQQRITGVSLHQISKWSAMTWREVCNVLIWTMVGRSDLFIVVVKCCSSIVFLDRLDF